MKNVVIDKMLISDLEEIADKLILEFDDFWNYNTLKSELNNPKSIYIIAKIGREIVGFAGVIDTIDQMEITNIVVKKNYRNKGIGNKLLNELIEIAKENKKEQIILEVNQNNLVAIKLYENNNFKKVGFRKKYYNNIDNANIMALKIK